MTRRSMTSWGLILRRTWRRPLESLLAVSALGLGIGISTAMACILQGILLRPVPAAAPDRLVSIEADGGEGPGPGGVSPEELRAWRQGARSVAALCGWSSLGEVWSGDGMSAEEERGAFVSASFFRVVGTWPVLGRAFLDDEDLPGARRVVVIGDTLWRRRYRSDPRVVGRTVVLGGEPAEIIGVMPPGSRLPADVDFWQPLGPVLGSPGDLSALALVRVGVQVAQVRDELGLISEQVGKRSAAGSGSARRLVVLPFSLAYARSSRAVLSVLSVASLAVLLIACANVAVLLLLRAGSRRQELAVRAVLGGTPSRIFTLALAEVAVLALWGGAAGLLVAAACLRLYQAAGGLVQASWIAIRLDARALLPLVVAVIAVTALADAGPALQASRVSPAAILKVNPAKARPFRSRSAARWCLVSLELCLSAALLVCALQMIQSVHNLFAFDLAREPEKVWTARLLLDLRERPTQATRMSFFRELSAATQDLPGVAAVAYADYQVVQPALPAEVEVERAPPGSGRRSARCAVISEHFFATLGRRPIAGRDFSPRDRRDTVPVIIVNRSFARQFISGDPLGRRIRLAGEGAQLVGEGAPAPWRTIVGVAPDLFLSWDDYGSILDQRPTEGFYLPMTQQRNVFGMAILVRTLGDPASFARSFRPVLRRLAPSTPPSYAGTLAERLSSATARHRLLRGLLTVLALAALALTVISLYGLVSFLAARRRREIAIRMSLGARRADIVALVAREASLQLVAGSAAGLALSAALARSFSSLLIGVSALDWRLAAMVVAVLAGVALAACLLPVRRALRLDPMADLRAE